MISLDFNQAASPRICMKFVAHAAPRHLAFPMPIVRFGFPHLVTLLATASERARKLNQLRPGCSASAGVAITHSNAPAMMVFNMIVSSNLR